MLSDCAKIVVVVHQQIQLLYIYKSLFQCCHSIVVALSALVAGHVASCGCQTALTLNHGVQVRASFCFVVLVVLLHVRHNFVPVVMVGLFSGLCGDLSVECGTELLNVPALSGMQLALVFGVDFCDLHHVPVVPPTVLADVVVHGVTMLFAAGVRAALFVLVLALAEVGSRADINLCDGWICATQLVNDRILIIYQNVIVSL